MSHTTTITSIMITDENALRAAVAELKRRGVLKGELLENKVPRAYSHGQQGMSEPADLCLDLQLDGSDYDIGFYKTDKGYEARTDFYKGDINRVLGAKPEEGETGAKCQMGQLYQEYALQVADREFTQQGHNVERVNQEDGSVQLVVGIAA